MLQKCTILTHLHFCAVVFSPKTQVALGRHLRFRAGFGAYFAHLNIRFRAYFRQDVQGNLYVDR